MSKIKCPKVFTHHLLLDNHLIPISTQNYSGTPITLLYWHIFYALSKSPLLLAYAHAIILFNLKFHLFPHFFFQVSPHYSFCITRKLLEYVSVFIASLPILLWMLCNQTFDANLLKLLPMSSSSKTTQSYGHFLRVTIQDVSKAFEKILFLEPVPLCGFQMPHSLGITFIFLPIYSFLFSCSSLSACPF